MPHPLPSATVKFEAGEENKSNLDYGRLPRSPVVKTRHVTYPSLTSTGRKAPATKRPMGMTLPILAKMGTTQEGISRHLPPLDGRG